MSSPLRLAVSESLRATAGEALRAAQPAWQLVAGGPARDQRQRERWLQVWHERQGGRGAAALAPDAALADPSVQAVLRSLDREADAVLLAETDPGCAAAWQLLESRTPRLPCADVWIAFDPRPGGAGPPPLGWFDWPAADAGSAAADQFRVAAAALRALPVVVQFAGGPNPTRVAAQRWLTTLRARGPAAEVALYSPLLYRTDGLQAAAFVEKLRRQAGPGPLVLCVPRLSRRDFATAWQQTGGPWSGPFRAGAELPAARLPAAAPVARLAATLRVLRQLAPDASAAL